MNPADRYRRLAARFDALLRTVPADRWAWPSPCDEWTAADIVDHVVDTERDLLGRMPFAPTTTPIAPQQDRMAAWEQVRAQIQLALDTPDHAEHAYDGYFGPTTFAATVDQFYNFDLVVHTWDLARATQQPEFEPIEPLEMVTIRAAMASIGDMMRQPGLFGPEIMVAEGADEQTRFLGYLGRTA